MLGGPQTCAPLSGRSSRSRPGLDRDKRAGCLERTRREVREGLFLAWC
ncbi:hypothetical protein AIOL_003622 [Candidatus Rhodobacter oscarellae]|uniref:Uncharacterized protein n=1 Tax=Candidatus Rhodobacter oscarellae TaxID=1675527 RepID=A0A0J9EAG7_9RHOB|nr:hypothetical protein AIOL_003622 [Candidatus Rhodobacter lobularis]